MKNSANKNRINVDGLKAGVTSFVAYVAWACNQQTPAFPGFCLSDKIREKIKQLETSMVASEIGNHWEDTVQKLDDVESHFKRALASYAKGQLPGLTSKLAETYCRCNGGEATIRELQLAAGNSVDEFEKFTSKFFEPREASEKYWVASAAIDAVFSENERVIAERTLAKKAARQTRDKDAVAVHHGRVAQDVRSIFSAIDSLQPANQAS